MTVVSVVVPAYNAQERIGGCLSALLDQPPGGPPFEVIVVDDGSTDRTAEVVTCYPGVTVVRQPNRGPAAARNAGARRATGAILVFTDADCEPTPDWLAEMTAPFRDPGVVAVKGAYRTRQPGIVARLAQVEFEERYDRLARFPAIDFVDSYSAAVRAQAFWVVGAFDPAFPYPNNEDVDFSFRLARAGGRIVFNPRALVYHRHPDTAARYLRTKFWRGYWRTVVYRRFPEKAVVDSYTPQSLKAQILCVFGGLAALAASPLVPGVGWLAAALGMAFVGTAVPFLARSCRAGVGLGSAALLFLVLRASALGAGVAWALLGPAWQFPSHAPARRET